MPQGRMQKWILMMGQLKQNGFETTLFKIGDKGGSITAESKKFNVALMGGEGNVSVSVSIKKPE